MRFNFKESYTFQDLLQVVELLRGPEGCPWDKAQTHSSIRANLLEEAYEVADAIDLKDTMLLKEELGDLLLQVLLHSQMEKEQESFAFEEVCSDLCKKLVNRHPHVFGEKAAESEDEALLRWEEAKNKEKNRTNIAEKLESVPKALPALMYAQKIQKRAEAHGPKSLEEALAQLNESIESTENINVGQMLFSAVNVARLLGVDAEEALSIRAREFIKVSQSKEIGSMAEE